jgi:hypothetical protein
MKSGGEGSAVFAKANWRASGKAPDKSGNW